MLDCPITDSVTAALKPAEVHHARVHVTEWDEAEDLAVIFLEIKLFCNILYGGRTALSVVLHDLTLISRFHLSF